ncbi:hypothetical protein FLK61_29860 [Paenalkalicoccus suaedae]|uniref:Uncharacterized protein n=1 Tax=Paenalkalicoccus suaedae TaxID=2592382 RepID=A0A859FDM3_9BACI|nr:hypothetical protein [Paenalkalicoccus suaedae]QKS70931.1 hypothetical protein FLK61_29860 [Paenalkalicoccus suaedae]
MRHSEKGSLMLEVMIALFILITLINVFAHIYAMTTSNRLLIREEWMTYQELKGDNAHGQYTRVQSPILTERCVEHKHKSVCLPASVTLK